MCATRPPHPLGTDTDPPITVPKPRERLLQWGPDCLSDAELVGVLLGDGADSVKHADEWIAAAGGLARLLASDLPSLRGLGVGDARAVALLAVGELARRQARRVMADRIMERPDLVARYVFLRFGNEDHEILGVFFLDMRRALIGEAEIFRGGQAQGRVEPRAILRQALVRHAAGILLFHTHPGGHPAPSAEDVEFTVRMAFVCELMGVRLVDHLIVGADGAWYSFQGAHA